MENRRFSLILPGHVLPPQRNKNATQWSYLYYLSTRPISLVLIAVYVAVDAVSVDLVHVEHPRDLIDIAAIAGGDGGDVGAHVVAPDLIGDVEIDVAVQRSADAGRCAGRVDRVGEHGEDRVVGRGALRVRLINDLQCETPARARHRSHGSAQATGITVGTIGRTKAAGPRFSSWFWRRGG